MPTYKNSFQSPAFIEEVILDDKGKKLGTLRIKPSRETLIYSDPVKY